MVGTASEKSLRTLPDEDSGSKCLLGHAGQQDAAVVRMTTSSREPSQITVSPQAKAACSGQFPRSVAKPGSGEEATSVEPTAPCESRSTYWLRPRCTLPAPVGHTGADLASVGSEPLPVCHSSVFTNDLTGLQEQIRESLGISTKDRSLVLTPQPEKYSRLDEGGEELSAVSKNHYFG